MLFSINSDNPAECFSFIFNYFLLELGDNVVCVYQRGIERTTYLKSAAIG